MLVRVERCTDVLRVLRGRSREDDRVDFLAREQIVQPRELGCVAVTLAARLQTLGIGIADRSEPTAGGLVDVARELRAPVADPGQSDGDFVHFACSPSMKIRCHHSRQRSVQSTNRRFRVADRCSSISRRMNSGLNRPLESALSDSRIWST